ncbi:peptidase S8 [Paenibacillus selenitireducens]|uniref:Peptidase S8 n=1 Tax=Paenibacillus selenitireducens TaxID=1324314 RepID=A0A1T2XF24_9BACL|nr:S8 family peptidase [Paenibacillus selenitireducens]OPA78428.1 peptidase S8 [Paenibacillus selenitireducens]
MRRGLIALLFVIGIGALLYPIVAPKNPANPTQPANPAPVPQATPHITTLQEKNMKEMVLKNDVELTQKMCKIECTNHVQMMLHKLDKATPARIQAYASKMQKDHKHIGYLIWMDNRANKQYEYGALPSKMEPEAKKTLQQHILTAKSKVKKRENYESAPVLKGNHKYLVMGIPAKNSERGMVAVVNQEILNTVNKHQRRNLRLIPYPHDHKFRVKTVDNDNMKPKRATQGEDNADTSHYYTNEIVVRFKHQPTADQMEKIKRDIHCTHVRHVGYAYIFRSNKMSAEALTSYFKAYDPVYVEPHFLYLTNEVSMKTTQNDSGTDQPNDSLYKQYQWNLPIIETNKGWHLSKGKKEVIVGIVDTGVDLTHPDLKGQLLKGYNAIDPSLPPTDDVGHGTHVAGIIGALVNNHEGVAGMTWYNKILPVKVLDDSGAGTSYSVAQGIIWAADHGAKVINMSLGNYAEASFLHDAIKYAYDKDVVLVAATGNDNTDQPGYPAAYPEVFAVSATTKTKEKASFSNYGDYVDVVAPGENIASTFMDNQYAALSGTSMACPHVSALAALIRSVNPNLKNTEVMDIMRKNVIDLGQSGRDIYFGYGQIDVVKALEAADQQTHTLNFFPYFVKKQMDKAASKYQ